MVIGYSGSNYANLGMGWVPTSTNDVYTSANSDYQSRLELYDGLQIYGSGVSVTSGQNVTWKMLQTLNQVQSNFIVMAMKNFASTQVADYF